MQVTRRLDSNWDMTFGSGLANFCKDSESVAQNVQTRLMLLQGEWFLDISAGVPYLANDYSSRAIMEKPTDMAFVEATLKQTILDTDGVDVIISFSAVFDHSTRLLSVVATLRDVYGNVFTIQVTK